MDLLQQRSSPAHYIYYIPAPVVGMPGNERQAATKGEEAEDKAQQPQGQAGEGPRSCPQQDAHTQPSHTQVTVPMKFGSTGPFLTPSQLHVLLQQQCPNEEVSMQLLHLVSLNPQLGQRRPSVLRRGTHLISQAQPAHPKLSAWAERNSTSTSLCKVEANGAVRVATTKSEHSPLQTSPSPNTKHKHGSSHSSPNESTGRPKLGTFTPLFVNGVCRWPGCEEIFEEYPQFLKHLYRDHSHGDRSIAQWRVQRDIVQHMENQLSMEKQKLLAMQLHLRMSEHMPAESSKPEGSEETHSLVVGFPQPWPSESSSCGSTKESAELVPQGYWQVSTAQLIPDLVPSIDCYKYTNIRPPYTYASLIRWAILDSPEKQMTLNEIYHWFTRMFFYFRHNTATWKNAVRHNLSLHKCFVRVEGGKGAVWTVDEAEFQKRKGQKFNRVHDMKWLTPY